MTNEQMNALRKIEQMVKEGKLSPLAAHARRNAIGAGMGAYREQFPDEAESSAPAKSTVGKIKMPAPKQTAEEEEK